MQRNGLDTPHAGPITIPRTTEDDGSRDAHVLARPLEPPRPIRVWLGFEGPTALMEDGVTLIRASRWETLALELCSRGHARGPVRHDGTGQTWATAGDFARDHPPDLMRRLGYGPRRNRR
jgi:hypothetical protein